MKITESVWKFTKVRYNSRITVHIMKIEKEEIHHDLFTFLGVISPERVDVLGLNKNEQNYKGKTINETFPLISPPIIDRQCPPGQGWSRDSAVVVQIDILR